jgi:hypothetical protein
LWKASPALNSQNEPQLGLQAQTPVLPHVRFGHVPLYTKERDMMKGRERKFIFFSKAEDSKIDQVLSGGWYQWEGEDILKGQRRVNMVKMLCTHV